MIFQLKESAHFYKDGKAIEPLQKLGFKFNKDPGMFMGNEYGISYDSEPPTIEINSIEELNAFTEEYGVIVYSEGVIEIYNDYRE